MRIRFCTAVAVLLLGQSLPVSADCEPIPKSLTVKNFQLGGLKSCHPDWSGLTGCHNNPNGTVSCIETWRGREMTLAGQPLKSGFATYYRSRLAELKFTMHSGYILDAIPNMKTKYGAPGTVKENTVQNRFGASFQNMVITWTKGDVLITLKARDLEISRGSITYTYLPLTREIEDRRAKGDASDF